MRFGHFCRAEKDCGELMQNLTFLIKPASSLCNMRCSYCFYSDVSDRRKIKSHGIMKDEVLDILIKRAFDLGEVSVSFVFQGGEPTLAGLGFFERVVELEKKYNTKRITVYNSIQTNGILIDDEWADFFRRNSFLVGISLDGTKEIHDKYRRLKGGEGSFDRVSEAISTLCRHGVDFNILCVVNKDVARCADKIYTELKKYKYLQFIPMIDDFVNEAADGSLTDEDYGIFLVRLFDNYAKDIKRGEYVSIRDFDSYLAMLCGMPPSSCAMSGKCGGYFTVEADGSVYPCDFYVTDEYKMGNITDSSLIELMRTDTALGFIKSSLTVSPECRECRWAALCRGGCRRHREPFPSLSKYCASYKKFFDECYEKMCEILTYLKGRR